MESSNGDNEARTDRREQIPDVAVDPSLRDFNSVLNSGHWKVVAMNMALLFAVTAIVYWPACRNDFVNWDDPAYVLQQPGVLNGLQKKTLWWAMTANVAGNWHPLTLISLQTDSHLFGIDPYSFHRTSVLLHAMNASLAYIALVLLTGSVWRSAVVAALFALHPLRVESVAWVSERKDVLSGLLFFLVLISYAFFARRPSLFRYLCVLLFLALGLMSKAMLVTTPCVLMLLDFWPLNRWRNRHDSGSSRTGLITEKLPMFALSIAVSVVIVFCQGKAFDTTDHSPPQMRVMNAFVSTVTYLGQTVWPVHLSPYYGYRVISIPSFVSAMMILVGLSFVALWQRNQRPYLVVGWLWFLGMLVPVCGLIQVGTQSQADRYVYLPHVGLFLAVVWSAADIARRFSPGKQIAACLVAACLMASSVLTIRQIAVWHDSESLWRQAYSVDPYEALVIQPNLIRTLISNGKKIEALRITKDSIATADKSHPRALIWLANLLAVQGDHATCADALTKALKSFSHEGKIYSFRGKTFAALGRWQEAAEDFQSATTLMPSIPSNHFHLAHALGKNDRAAESRRVYDEALARWPKWPQSALADAWRMSTSSDALERLDLWPVCLAEQVLESTRTEAPHFLDVLAATQANAGQFDKAITTAGRALQLAASQGHDKLASAIERRITHYEKHEAYR